MDDRCLLKANPVIMKILPFRCCVNYFILGSPPGSPYSKVHRANMGPTWVLSSPDGPHEPGYQVPLLQYIPRNMHTVFDLLCFVVVIHWLIFPYPSGLLHWHCGNLTIAPVPAKQPWWIWINTSCEISMNDYITTTKQSTTKPCAYLLGYTVSGFYWD